MYLSGSYGSNCNSNHAIIDLFANEMSIVYQNGSSVNLKKYEGVRYVMYACGEVYKHGDCRISWDDFFEFFDKQTSDCNMSEVLSKIDGYYMAVFIDKENNDTYLVTDRLGMWPLYLYTQNNKVIVWSTSINSIDKLVSGKIEEDKEAISTFLDISHFLSDRTLYKNVRRVKPSMITKISRDGSIVDEKQYWSWNKLSPAKIEFDAAVDRLHELLVEAVDCRVNSHDSYCLTLSGGLDSRALLAITRGLGRENIKCVTFGKEDSPDLNIARQVCSILGYEHKIVNIDENNWIEGRQEGVEKTSGMKSILHMHVLNSINEIKSVGTHVINGYVGDLVLGGGYLQKNNGVLSSSEVIAQSKFGHNARQIDFQDNYFEHVSSDPIFIYHRGVRFTSMGSDVVNDQVVNIKPFVDNRLLEFVYSLDDEYRYNGKLYHSMLLKYYPEVFSTIPWQTTGKVITGKDNDSKTKSIYKSLRTALVGFVKSSPWHYKIKDIYLKLTNKEAFVDYSNWASSEDFQNYVAEILNEKSYISCVLGYEKVRECLDKASVNKDVESLGCLLSLELYLRNVKNDC